MKASLKSILSFNLLLAGIGVSTLLECNNTIKIDKNTRPKLLKMIGRI